MEYILIDATDTPEWANSLMAYLLRTKKLITRAITMSIEESDT